MALGVKDQEKAAEAKPAKAKADSAEPTPSQAAVDEVGLAKEGESKEQLIARAEKYAAEKRKHRWGA
jgi:hypothetical protein